MYREIGSFYEYRNIGSNSAESKGMAVISYLRSHIGNKNINFYDSGRSALRQSLSCFGRSKHNIKCLVPAYTCESVLRPFTDAGFELFFYNVDLNLKISDSELERLIKEIDPAVFLFHNYYGMDNINPKADYIRRYRRDGGIVIEDYTQFLFGMSQSRVECVDHAICSLRKWFPITDGAFLISDDICEQENSVFIEFVRLKSDAQRQKAQYLAGDIHIDKDTYRGLNANAEELLDKTGKVYGMSHEAYSRLEMTGIECIRQRRYENAKVLEKGLSQNGKIQEIMHITDDVVPLFYPIYADERKQLQTILRDNEIYAPVLWPKDEIVNISNASTEYIYNNLLCIPCDERYNKKDMERIVSVIQMI